MVEFLSRVSILTRDIDISILSVCPSVHLSVRDVPVVTGIGLGTIYGYVKEIMIIIIASQDGIVR